MATTAEALAMALGHYQAGRLAQAEAICRQILKVEPTHGDTLHVLGAIAQQRGQHAAAVEWIGQAISLNPTVEAYYNTLGVSYRALGRQAEAVGCFQRAVELNPRFAQALVNLGICWKMQGKLDEAVACYRRALDVNPDDPTAHNSLANSLKSQGKFDEAIASYRRALELNPNYADAHYNLGNTLRDQGQFDEAVASYRRVLDLKPEDTATHNNLGNVLRDHGKSGEAAACYRRALAGNPNFIEAYNNLGNALRDEGKLDEAAANYRRATQLRPDDFEAWRNLANALSDLGRLDEAVVAYRQVLALRPDETGVLNSLGNALRNLGRPEEAASAYRRVLELKPTEAAVCSNLGNALHDLGRFDDAVDCYRKALEQRPDDAIGHMNLGTVLKDQGMLDEAVGVYRRALEINPDLSNAYSNLLMALQYRPEVTAAQLREAHDDYDRVYGMPVRADWVPHNNLPDPDRRLRLGFVSPDFARHPVGYFLIRSLESLDRRECDVVCYSDRPTGDDMTARFQASATEWHQVMGMTHGALAAEIRRHAIDILFDLAGHTARNRLRAFALKPAPIQITWIGYEGTTGLAAMDYLLADRELVPEGHEAHFREKVLRFAGSYVSFQPFRDAPAVGPLPAQSRGWVTFGCFNNPAKITPRVIDVWAEILGRVPTSRLLLKYGGMNDGSTRRRYATMLAERGIDPARLETLGWTTHRETLAEYNRVDIGLDPFPFSGSANTCGALWMGVPVVTWPGETFASRHGLTHLASVGLTETVARDQDEYVQRAVALAHDLPRLAAIRAGLRPQVATSPLCDGKRLADDLVRLLRGVWRDWCTQQQTAR